MSTSRLSARVPLYSGWIEEQRAGVLFAARGPRGSWGQPNIVIVGEPADNLASYAQHQLEALRSSLPEFALLAEERRNISGRDGLWREHTFVMQGQAIAQIQFYVIDAGRAFLLTYTCHPSALDISRPEAEKFFAKLQIDPT